MIKQEQSIPFHYGFHVVTDVKTVKVKVCRMHGGAGSALRDSFSKVGSNAHSFAWNFRLTHTNFSNTGHSFRPYAGFLDLLSGKYFSFSASYRFFPTPGKKSQAHNRDQCQQTNFYSHISPIHRRLPQNGFLSHHATTIELHLESTDCAPL